MMELYGGKGEGRIRRSDHLVIGAILAAMLLPAFALINFVLVFSVLAVVVRLIVPGYSVKFNDIFWSAFWFVIGAAPGVLLGMAFYSVLMHAIAGPNGTALEGYANLSFFFGSMLLCGTATGIAAMAAMDRVAQRWEERRRPLP